MIRYEYRQQLRAFSNHKIWKGTVLSQHYKHNNFSTQQCSCWFLLQSNHSSMLLSLQDIGLRHCHSSRLGLGAKRTSFDCALCTQFHCCAFANHTRGHSPKHSPGNADIPNSRCCCTQRLHTTTLSCENGLHLAPLLDHVDMVPIDTW